MVSLDALRQGTSAVAVVGLGYVGLPLAVALARHFDVIGFDVNSARVEALRQGGTGMKDAVHTVAADTGLNKNELYAAAVRA